MLPELVGISDKFKVFNILIAQLFEISEQLNSNLVLLQQIIIIDNLHRKWAFQDFAINRFHWSDYNSFLMIST